jgi:CubicO group peptidase (beta-lactamase class C family)
MVINFKFKSLFTLALLMSFNSFAKESVVEKNVVENNSQAPEATKAETTLAFRDIPFLKKAFIDTTPATRKGDLAVAELGIDGGNKNMIVKLAKELADNKHGDYDSLLIAHKGKFLFESYYKRGRIDLPHFQSSATKGYTSLLLGRAIQLGYLTMADLDKPLISFLKDLDPINFVDGVEKITLHQALTMRSGLRFSDEENANFRKNPETFKGLDQVQAFLELSDPITAKSQIYKYQGPDPIMVMQVLDAVVPGSAKDFIKNEFFGKLGITSYKWRDDKSGLPIGDGRLSLTSRDMLKLGLLVSDKGQWKGEQLLSADYLVKATSGITRPTEEWQPASFFYGYLWYQSNVVVEEKSYDIKIAWGGGGNRVISIEALDLVVVITGLDWDDKIFTQVTEKILPAFVR